MNPLKQAQRIVELEQICEMKEAHIKALTELLEQRVQELYKSLEYGKEIDALLLKRGELFQALTKVANKALLQTEELENKLILASGLIHRYENNVPTTLEEANAILRGSTAKVLQHIKDANKKEGDQ